MSLFFRSLHFGAPLISPASPVAAFSRRSPFLSPVEGGGGDPRGGRSGAAMAGSSPPVDGVASATPHRGHGDECARGRGGEWQQRGDEAADGGARRTPLVRATRRAAYFAVATTTDTSAPPLAALSLLWVRLGAVPAAPRSRRTRRKPSRSRWSQ